MTIEDDIIAVVKRIVSAPQEVEKDLVADIEDGIVYVMRKDGSVVAMMNPDTYEAICRARKT